MVKTRDEMAAEAMPLIRVAALKFGTLPRHVDRDELESAGGQAIVEAMAHFDPGHGTPWRSFAYTFIRNAMRSAIRRAASRREVGLCPVNSDGEEAAPPRDPRSADPADVAAAMEAVRPRESIRRMRDAMPDPGEVAEQVTRLRAAMFGAVSEQAVQGVMAAVVAKAQGGDLKAAKLLIDLLAPGRSGVTVNQQAIVVRSGDLT